MVSYETVRLEVNKFGPKYFGSRKVKGKGFGDTFYIDEVFTKIKGVQHLLWRGVDQDKVAL